MNSTNDAPLIQRALLLLAGGGAVLSTLMVVTSPRLWKHGGPAATRSAPLISPLVRPGLNSKSTTVPPIGLAPR